MQHAWQPDQAGRVASPRFLSAFQQFQSHFKNFEGSNMNVFHSVSSCSPGTHLKHMKQARQGQPEPKHKASNFIKAIPHDRAKSLATGALHLACRYFAALTINNQAHDLKVQLRAWYNVKGWRIPGMASASSDTCSEPHADEEDLLQAGDI